MSALAQPAPSDSLAWNPPFRAKSGLILLPVIGLGFSLLFGVLNYIRAATFNPPARLGDIVTEGLSRWMLYAALAPAVAVLVSRWPLSSGPRGRRLLLHLAGVAVLAFLHNVLVATIYAIFHVYP